MAKGFVRLPLAGTKDRSVLIKISLIQMVSQDNCDIDEECFVSTSYKKKSHFKVALPMSGVEHLIT